MGPRNDPAQKKRKESGRQPLKIDGGRRQVGLDLHVGEAAPHRARERMPRLGLAVEALGTPAMTLIDPLVFFGPVQSAAAGAEQSRISITDDDSLVDPSP